MSRYIGDVTLGLKSQAWAILAMLSASDCDGLGGDWDTKFRDYKIEIKTYAWYNGRERGFCLEVRPSMASRKALLVTFGEHRNTDGIFVDAWEVDKYFLNEPTVEDFTDEAYERRMSVPYGNVGQAVEVIRDKIEAFMASQFKAGEGHRHTIDCYERNDHGPLAYKPCREDGLDRNLRNMNSVDYEAEQRVTPMQGVKGLTLTCSVSAQSKESKVLS